MHYSVDNVLPLETGDSAELERLSFHDGGVLFQLTIHVPDAASTNKELTIGRVILGHYIIRRHGTSIFRVYVQHVSS